MESQTRLESLPPPTDAVFDMLGHRYRRLLLVSLLRSDGARPLGSIARDVAARDDDRPGEALPEPEIEKVRSMLHHGHVPKLLEHDVVSWEGERLVLEDRVEHLVPYLEEAVDDFSMDAVQHCSPD